MVKLISDAALDAALDVVDLADVMAVCSTAPTTRAEALSTVGAGSGWAIAQAAMTANGSYTKANGDTSGRKITVATRLAVTIDSSATAQHIALCDASNLLYVTTCTNQALTEGGTVDVPTWDIEIRDPT